MSTARTFSGVASSEGIAIGRARVLAPPVIVVERRIDRERVPAEVRRLREAVNSTDEHLALLSARLEAEHLHEGHLILEAHRLMLRDTEIVGGAERVIEEEELGAECAVRRTIDSIRARFDRMDDAYLRERGADVGAIGERLLRTLFGLPQLSTDTLAAGTIGIGSILSPIDALNLPRSGLSGFAAEHGGQTSHAAIILRALEIPFVAGVHGLVGAVQPGDSVIIDGTRGEVIVNASEDSIAKYERWRSGDRSRARALKSRAAGPTITRDGVQIEVGANIEAPAEVAAALEFGADCVGLVRTELLYLDRAELPGEEEQFRDAVAVLTALDGRSATFRTLDIGGEKLPLAMTVAAAANPSLGLRGLRFSRRHPDIFRTQMRALYRASTFGPLRIMFPLVSGISELNDALRTCAAISTELAGQGVTLIRAVPIGVMIETPSAALTTDHLADAASFFSLGTNDLMQYTFAADRENEEVEGLRRPLHPAFLRLLKAAIDGARRGNRPIALCGDMAGHPAYTWILVALGLRSFSMPAASIPAVKSILASSTVHEMEALLERALTLRSETEVEDLVLEVMHRRFPLEAGEGRTDVDAVPVRNHDAT